jgi:hypothetical protein
METRGCPAPRPATVDVHEERVFVWTCGQVVPLVSASEPPVSGSLAELTRTAHKAAPMRSMRKRRRR